MFRSDEDSISILDEVPPLQVQRFALPDFMNQSSEATSSGPTQPLSENQ